MHWPLTANKGTPPEPPSQLACTLYVISCIGLVLRLQGLQFLAGLNKTGTILASGLSVKCCLPHSACTCTPELGGQTLHAAQDLYRNCCPGNGIWHLFRTSLSPTHGTNLQCTICTCATFHSLVTSIHGSIHVTSAAVTERRGRSLCPP